MVIVKYMQVGKNISILDLSTNLTTIIQLCNHVSLFMHYKYLCICLVICVRRNNETSKILFSWQVFCDHFSSLPPPLFMPLSPMLQSWRRFPTPGYSAAVTRGCCGCCRAPCMLAGECYQPWNLGDSLRERFPSLFLNRKLEKALQRWTIWPSPSPSAYRSCAGLTAPRDVKVGMAVAAARDGEKKQALVNTSSLFCPLGLHVQSFCSRPLFSTDKTHPALPTVLTVKCAADRELVFNWTGDGQ